MLVTSLEVPFEKIVLAAKRVRSFNLPLNKIGDQSKKEKIQTNELIMLKKDKILLFLTFFNLSPHRNQVKKSHIHMLDYL